MLVFFFVSYSWTQRCISLLGHRVNEFLLPLCFYFMTMKASSQGKKLDKELNKSQYFGTGKSLDSIFLIFIMAVQIKLLLMGLYMYLQRVV